MYRLVLALVFAVAACGEPRPAADASASLAPDAGTGSHARDLGCGPQICAPGAALRATYEGAPATWPAARIDADVAYTELAALPRPARDGNDDQADSAALVALGEALFHEPALSRSGQISCASCHTPELAFTDRVRTAFGHDRQRGRRNTPTVLDKAGQPHFMWDGSAASLEAQAAGPITNPVEMAAEPDRLVARLAARPAWRARFAKAFETDAADTANTAAAQATDPVRFERVTAALAAYQRTLHRPTAFDRFMAGEHDRLDDQQIFGLHLFRTKARCANCHMGARLTDDRFHNLGLHYYGRAYEDQGRYGVTGRPADMGAFRTPSLRHVGDTAPYMHNGLFPTLVGVVNLYNAGGARPSPRADQAQDPLFPATSDRLRPLDLSRQEVEALAAFLEAL